MEPNAKPARKGLRHVRVQGCVDGCHRQSKEWAVEPGQQIFMQLVVEGQQQGNDAEPSSVLEADRIAGSDVYAAAAGVAFVNDTADGARRHDSGH